MRVFRYMYTSRFILLAIQAVHIQTRQEMPFHLFYSVLIYDFNGFLLWILLCKKRLAHKQSRSVPKTSLNTSLHGFSGIGNHMCTWLHVCNCKIIYRKMNLNRWTLAITGVPTTLTLAISDNWLRTSAVIHIYKVRARRNGYRMFISVYILWYRASYQL